MEISKLQEFAKCSREFITLQRFGTLSTMSAEKEGFPFGSIAPYDIDERGGIIIHVARISQHYKNLCQEPRASVLVFDRFGFFNPQLHARATALVNFEIVPASNTQNVYDRYNSRFPGLIDTSIANSFCFLRGQIEKIRWIGGFGDIGWVDARKFSEVPHDPVCYVGMDIIDHMNQDHELAMRDLLKSKGVDATNCRIVEMVFVSNHGFRIAYGSTTKRESAAFDFPTEASTASDVRSMLVEMVKRARN